MKDKPLWELENFKERLESEMLAKRREAQDANLVADTLHHVIVMLGLKISLTTERLSENKGGKPNEP